MIVKSGEHLVEAIHESPVKFNINQRRDCCRGGFPCPPDKLHHANGIYAILCRRTVGYIVTADKGYLRVI